MGWIDGAIGYALVLWGAGIVFSFHRLTGIIAGLIILAVGLGILVHGFGVLVG